MESFLTPKEREIIIPILKEEFNRVEKTGGTQYGVVSLEGFREFVVRLREESDSNTQFSTLTSEERLLVVHAGIELLRRSEESDLEESCKKTLEILIQRLHLDRRWFGEL